MSLPQMENLFSTQTHVLEQGQSSESITNICSSSDPQDNDSSDISLKLGSIWAYLALEDKFVGEINGCNHSWIVLFPSLPWQLKISTSQVSSIFN
ncbi:mads-box protein jointless [Quercus suber]|uniref:Mads-box protein jointless n=1 Tax=Quercus suber TaxID=58331 RepID=A0AAW0LS14_QUESU